MAQMIQIKGRIYRETGERMVQIGGYIHKETVTAAPPSVTAIPPKMHKLGSQHAVIVAHRMGGAIE